MYLRLDLVSTGFLSVDTLQSNKAITFLHIAVEILFATLYPLTIANAAIR